VDHGEPGGGVGEERKAESRKVPFRFPLSVFRFPLSETIIIPDPRSTAQTKVRKSGNDAKKNPPTRSTATGGSLHVTVHSPGSGTFSRVNQFGFAVTGRPI
jgi:hypothetical protein